MAKANTAIEILALTVGPSMRDRVGHAFNQNGRRRRSVQMNYTGYSTHN